MDREKRLGTKAKMLTANGFPSRKKTLCPTRFIKIVICCVVLDHTDLMDPIVSIVLLYISLLNIIINWNEHQEYRSIEISEFPNKRANKFYYPFTDKLMQQNLLCFRQVEYGRGTARRGTALWHSDVEVEQRAEMFCRGSRHGDVHDDQRMMFENRVASKFGNDKSSKDYTPKKLTKAIALHYPRGSSDRWNQEYMKNFLDHSQMTGVCTPYGEKIQNVFPSGAPALDHLINDSRSEAVFGEGVVDEMKLFEIRENRGLHRCMLDTVKVVEVVVGRSSGADCVKMIEFYQDMRRIDDEATPLQFTSLDCEERRILDTEYDLVTRPNKIEFDRVKLSKEKQPGEHWKQLPVKIMIGNGHSWAIMITIPVTEEDGEFYLERIEFQDLVLEFLLMLPTFVGVGIKSDVMEIEELVSACTGREFQMSGYIDLWALAVAAGYNATVGTMGALAFLIVGTTMNKRVSEGDGLWGRLWCEMTSEMKVYCLGDVKFGYQVTLILFGVMVRTLFPDPDIVLLLTRSTHRKFGEWFARYLFETLRGVEVKADGIKEVRSLRELFHCLRYRLDDGSLSDGPPERVITLLKLYGKWANVMQGGARYLHFVRYHFLKQHEILTVAGAPFWLDMMYYRLDREAFEAAVYGVENVGSLDYRRRTSCPRGLQMHPQIVETSATTVGFSTLTSADVESIASDCNGIRREMLYEAARISYRDIPEFLKSVVDDDYFCQWIRSYYNEPRNIFWRTTGSHCNIVEETHEMLREKTEKHIEHEKERIEALYLEADQRKARVEQLEYELSRYDDDSIPPNNITFRGQMLQVGSDVRRIKGSRVDYEPFDLADELDSFQPGEPESRRLGPYVNDDEFIPKGKCPLKRGSGSRGRGSGMSTLARDEVEEPYRSPPRAYVEIDGYEVVALDRGTDESDNEGYNPREEEVERLLCE